MLTKARISIGVACVALLCIATQAFAHQSKAALTTILFNPRTENIEVMHRFNLHDAEHAVKQVLDKKADIVRSEQTQQQFSAYVTEHFAMLGEDGQDLELTTVGHEVEGKHFWIYQETRQPAELQGLTIQHNALRELWPTQTNTINIEGIGDLKTLTFTDNVELLSVEFK